MCNGRAIRYTFFAGPIWPYPMEVDEPDGHDHADDATLARRIAAAPGDAAAETELYRRLAPRIRLYGLKHLRDAQAAADLAQQVMLLTLERLRAGKLRDAERLASFVFGTCRMQVLDLRRTGARRARLLDRYATAPQVEEPAAALGLDHARVAECLDRLSERERSVLVMTFHDEQPAREVAAALGLSEGNVRVIRHRGLGRLRDCVNGEGEPP